MGESPHLGAVIWNAGNRPPPQAQLKSTAELSTKRNPWICECYCAFNEASSQHYDDLKAVVIFLTLLQFRPPSYFAPL